MLKAIKKNVRSLICRLGIHGPVWGGHGLSNVSPSNAIVGPGHRKCLHCEAEWGAYETPSRGQYRTIAWTRIRPQAQAAKT